MEVIREKTRRREILIVSHAIIEARKDGITPQNIREVLQSGKIIEDYPDRGRCLIYGTIANRIPVHVLCEYYFIPQCFF
jgi:hypothetical protein